MSKIKFLVLVIAIFIASILVINVVDLQSQPVLEPISSKVEKAENNIPVSATEDLMREHGLLDRILLIYQEFIRRLEKNETFPSEALNESTQIIRDFIQNYHEKLEENYLFTRFRQVNKSVDLIDVLLKQHEASHEIVDNIMALEKFQSPEDKNKLIRSMRSFIRMYRPHKAREDTVLFPAFHAIVTPNEYEKLGEEFEAEEEKLFGKSGFEKTVGRVEKIEKSLGIYELSQFTPVKHKEGRK
ncbi:MAG: hemerythrin domain-containing protein [Candidatus Omnitrophica bacterium]|nr:hemerythrin domain-containing protein [Candidatus Omnitrophota bacterium]MDD5236120.1 hemerythrin domain-containing protein [Candidatus Omnitrophota bacterium]MDD5611215.1 hemerythrin domain-containing protein [Candidatus Omnitrophota bacterium]